MTTSYRTAAATLRIGADKSLEAINAIHGDDEDSILERGILLENHITMANERTAIANKALLKSNKRYIALTEEFKEATNSLNEALSIVDQLEAAQKMIDRIKKALEGVRGLLS